MKILEAKIKNFKRFSNLTISNLHPDTKLVLVVGSNGCGKSSLLEAFNVWYKFNCGFGHGSEDNYVKKHKELTFDINQNINLKFNTEDQKIIRQKKAMYFRTAYRNDSDFNISSFNKVDTPYANVRIQKMIQDDKTVSQNYQRLISYTLSGVFDTSNNNKTVETLREELIGQVKTSMKNVFDDLILNNIGDPLGDGSFNFEKGVIKSFNYQNLSGGEKSAFDLLLDFILKIRYYDDSVFFVDEPETHMHTSLQGKLVEEMYKLVPENSQLWLTTHSLGILRSAQKLLKQHPNSVAILDFSDHDFDHEVKITPAPLNKIVWEKFLSIALDDFAELIAPEYIILCEGSLEGRNRKDFDATIYNKVFNENYPNITFISGGNSNDLEKEDHSGLKILNNVLKSTTVVTLLDRDDKSADEVTRLSQQNVIVLSKRHLEAYLFDDEVIAKLANQQEKSDKIDSLLKQKNHYLQCNHDQQGKPLDDIKSSSGQIYNMLKKELLLTACGNNTDAFMRDTLAPLITPDMYIYKALRIDIIDQIIKP